MQVSWPRGLMWGKWREENGVETCMKVEWVRFVSGWDAGGRRVSALTPGHWRKKVGG